MPASRRARSAPKPLTIGFVGSADLDPKAIDALLGDLLPEDVTIADVYVPVTKATYTDSMAAVVAWLVDNEIAFKSVSDEAALKDRTLKKVIALAAEDIDGSQSATIEKGIVELVAGDEETPVEDGKLIVFFDADAETDNAALEEAEEAEVVALDMMDALGPITFADDGDDQAPDPEPDPEPEAPRRRGRAAAVEPEPAEEEPEVDENPPLTTGEKRRLTNLLKLGLIDLKRKLRELDPSLTTKDLAGCDKDYVADAILMAERLAKQEPASEPDEAQQEPAGAARRGRGASAAEELPEAVTDAESADGETDTREAVFARLRGSREVAERITYSLVSSTQAIIAEGDEEHALERAAAAVAASLMLFAEFVVSETRKPKQVGRPRKDGTPAQPKPPVDPDAPKRGRGRPRKDAD